MRNITQAFLDADISMPDDARERIFPQGLAITRTDSAQPEKRATDEHAEGGAATRTQYKPQSDVKRSERHHSDSSHNSEADDVTSEAHEIREQARKSRDPEAGENIL